MYITENTIMVFLSHLCNELWGLKQTFPYVTLNADHDFDPKENSNIGCYDGNGVYFQQL